MFIWCEVTEKGKRCLRQCWATPTPFSNVFLCPVHGLVDADGNLVEFSTKKESITIYVNDIKKWISKCNSLHSLQSIRAKTNKRIKSITQKIEESPFKHIPIEEKRKVLEPLFV